MKSKRSETEDDVGGGTKEAGRHAPRTKDGLQQPNEACATHERDADCRPCARHVAYGVPVRDGAWRNRAVRTGRRWASCSCDLWCTGRELNYASRCARPVALCGRLRCAACCAVRPVALCGRLRCAAGCSCCCYMLHECGAVWTLRLCSLAEFGVRVEMRVFCECTHYSDYMMCMMMCFSCNKNVKNQVSLIKHVSFQTGVV